MYILHCHAVKTVWSTFCYKYPVAISCMDPLVFRCEDVGIAVSFIFLFFLFIYNSRQCGVSGVGGNRKRANGKRQYANNIATAGY